MPASRKCEDRVRLSRGGGVRKGEGVGGGGGGGVEGGGGGVGGEEGGGCSISSGVRGLSSALAETASEPGSTSPEPPVHNIFSPRPSGNQNPPQMCRHATKIPPGNQNPPQMCRHGKNPPQLHMHATKIANGTKILPRYTGMQPKLSPETKILPS